MGDSANPSEGLHATQSIPISGILPQIRNNELVQPTEVHDSAGTRHNLGGAGKHGQGTATARSNGGLSITIDEENHLPRKHYPGWTPDRGKGYYHADRERKQRPSLVDTGREAGKSRVVYDRKNLLLVHSWLRDTFISALNTPLRYLLTAITLVYVLSFFFFAGVWWLVHKTDPECIYGMNGFSMAYMFSLVTQQTIGYGNTGPNDCYWGSVVITAQTMIGLYLDSITLGIIFARISHPKNRGRTIGISDSAVISRRDGILKFMFRVADFRETQVVEPNVKAYLYTWGKGRTTVEGELIPARIEQMEIGYIDGMLLLPIIIEHTIDERSPLCGHTHDSLMEVDAEVIVTFEGTTEMGNPFMARQSYLPNEILWGHQFCSIIRKPKPPNTHYVIDIESFHDVEPMAGLEMMPPGPLSKLVVTKAMQAVPYPLLGENTMVLSDSMVLAKDENGELAVMFRAGDTYPMQHLEVVVKAYLYRWRPQRQADCGKPNDCEVTALEVGYERGDDRLLLWLPVVCKHVINEDSPLASWLTPTGMLADADSCIAVVLEAYQYSNSQNRMRMRIYNVLEDIKRQHAFEAIISSPSETADYKPRVDWVKFHHTLPLPGAPVSSAQARGLRQSAEATITRTSLMPSSQRKPSMPLSKLSFYAGPDEEAIAEEASVASEAEADMDAGTAVATRQSTWQDSTGPSGQSGLERQYSHHSVPPEAQQTILTPSTDPESTFHHRMPAPPSISIEGDTGGSRHSSSRNSTIGRRSGASLGRSSGRSLRESS